MMSVRPVLLGLLWSLIYISRGDPAVDSKATHQVYSYTYHFQHNGSTDPKSFLDSILPDPPEGGSIFKTFFNPDLRGFVSKSYLPAGPSFNRIPTYEGIKKLVDDKLKDLQPAPPPEFIPIPPQVEDKFPNVNNEITNNLQNINYGFNGINQVQNFIPQHPRPVIPEPILPNIAPPPPPPVIDDKPITHVQTFEKDIPGGKIFEQIETYSYNPPPVSNLVTRSEPYNGGVRQTLERNHRSQQNFGQRTSYFRKEYRTGSSFPHNPILNENLQNGIEENQRNYGNPSWNVIGEVNSPVNKDDHLNYVNTPIQHNRNFAQPHNNNWRNPTVQNFVPASRVFGQRLNNVQDRINTPIQHINVPNHYNGRQNNDFVRPQPLHNPSPERANQLLGGRNSYDSGNQFNRGNLYENSIGNDRNYLNNAINLRNNHNQYDNNGDRGFHPRIGNNVNRDMAKDIINSVNNNLRNIDPQLNNVNDDRHGGQGRRQFSWDDDDDSIKWQINHHGGWGNRIRPPVRHGFTPQNGRPFSNGHSGPDVNPPNVHNNNPPGVNTVDMLKRTLEAFVGKELDIPALPHNGNGDGNYRNVDGGGMEKIFSLDRVVDGPNSFSRNRQIGFERNFRVNSDTGYQNTNQWSTNTARRLDAASSRDDFSKDFIDVFSEDGD